MARVGKVPFFTKFFFGFGQVGEATFLAFTLTFTALYYNQALQLRADLVGWALALGVLFDAVSDPAIGALSDRWKSKRGRRHPFLFAAPIPLAICLFFLFTPPEALTAAQEGTNLPPQFALFLWVAVWNILARFFLTLYVVPHLALGAELSNDYQERASIFSFNAIFGYGFGNIFGFTAWALLAGTSTRAYDGQIVPRHLDAANYPFVVYLACGFIVLGIWLCAFGTRKEAAHLSQPSENIEPFSVRVVVLEMLEACRNRNYMMLLIATFFFMLSQGMLEYLTPYMGTYFWGMEGAQLKWFGFSMLGGYVSGAVVAPFWIARFGKRFTCALMAGGYFIVIPLLVLDRLVGSNLIVPANGTPELLYLLLAHTGIYCHFIGGLNVTVMSMLADVIDQHALKTGHVQSGIFYSARTFFSKASYSAANLIAGIALMYAVRMPEGAIPGNLDAGVTGRLGWLTVFGGTGAVLSFFFYRKYQLTKDDHAKIREELDASH